MQLWLALALLQLLCVPLAYTGDEQDELAAQRVRKVLMAINDAIDREDVGAYMLQVDVSEPTFLIEQRAWITDAIDHGYENLGYSFLGGMGASQRSKSEIWAMVGIRWSEEFDGKPWDRVYLARFVSANAGTDVWTFAGPAWSHDLVDGRSDIRVLAGEHQLELVERVLNLAPEIVRRTERVMEQELDQQLVVKIYNKMNELQASISPAYKNPLTGWNEPGESIKILSMDSISDSRLSSLLAHEIGHAVSFEYGPEINNAPWWSLEGIAELVADEYRSASPEER